MTRARHFIGGAWADGDERAPGYPLCMTGPRAKANLGNGARQADDVTCNRCAAFILKALKIPHGGLGRKP